MGGDGVRIASLLISIDPAITIGFADVAWKQKLYFFYQKLIFEILNQKLSFSNISSKVDFLKPGADGESRGIVGLFGEEVEFHSLTENCLAPGKSTTILLWLIKKIILRLQSNVTNISAPSTWSRLSLKRPSPNHQITKSPKHHHHHHHNHQHHHHHCTTPNTTIKLPGEDSHQGGWR